MPILFKVTNNKFVEVTRESDPDDEYSGESTRTMHSIESIKLTHNNDFDVSGAFDENDIIGNIFLVYVVYSSGDSFSTHESAGIEYVECFLSKEKAMELVDTIKIQNKIYASHAKENQAKNDYFNHLKSIGIIETLEEDQKELGKKFDQKKFKSLLEHRLYFKDESGYVKLLSNPWFGYFDNLEKVECLELPCVEVLNIKKKKIK